VEVSLFNFLIANALTAANVRVLLLMLKDFPALAETKSGRSIVQIVNVNVLI
jgi:hypothetical protein